MQRLIISMIFAGVIHAQINKESKSMTRHVSKTKEEWQMCLTPEEYRVLREKGTERAFTGEFYNHKEDGTYVCAACENELFSSKTKYDSRSGWPSFYDVIAEGKIKTKTDNSMWMERIEIMCAKCDSHLGHVFDDGPNPTGKRYCVNSVSLNFNKKGLKTKPSSK